jgi:hypothetical protein
MLLLTFPSPNPLLVPLASRLGVTDGDGTDFALTGMENSKSSSQFSVTGLRRGGSADVSGRAGRSAAAAAPPPEDMAA